MRILVIESMFLGCIVTSTPGGIVMEADPICEEATDETLNSLLVPFSLPDSKALALREKVVEMAMMLP